MGFETTKMKVVRDTCGFVHLGSIRPVGQMPGGGELAGLGDDD